MLIFKVLHLRSFNTTKGLHIYLLTYLMHI